MPRIIVYHAGAGCDTGCCGHVVELDGDERFRFEHPWSESVEDFVKRLVTEEYGEEHCADIDWENCNVHSD